MNAGELPRRRDYTDELLKAFPTGQAVNPEGSVIDIPFQLLSGRPTALRVSLPAHFPHDRPVLCVLVPLQHPAVDNTGRVHIRSAEQWGALGIHPPDLVAVVREAFGVLLGGDAANQQGLLGGATGAGASGASAATHDGRMISLAGGLGPSPAGTGTAGGRAGSGTAGAGGGGPPLNLDPVLFLEGLSTEELEAALKDEEEMRKLAAKWLLDTPGARALEDVRRQNRGVAEANLALARSIEEARGHVAIVRSGDYAAMRSLFEGLYARQEAVVAKLGTTRLLGKLREEASKSDEASDTILERFQAGTLPVEAFVEQYVAAREAFHVIDLKRQAAEHGMAT